MQRRLIIAGASMIAMAVLASSTTMRAHAAERTDPGNGVIRVRSAYALPDTIERIKADIAAKGITFFAAIDQHKLAADAGIELPPSTLLVFGNPGLGSHFVTSRADAGLDWPVRLLVRQDSDGHVWASYTDFGWIARRHGIEDRPAQIAKASEVVASIVGSVATK